MATQQKIYSAESADIKHFVSGEKKKNDHYLHAVIHFDSIINENVLIQAVQATQVSLPLLSCRFVEKNDQAYWEEAGWKAQNMVYMDEADNRQSAIQKNLTIKLNEKVGPQLRIAVIRKDNQDSLAIVLNHMICDGGGFKDYLYLLSDCYSRIASGESSLETPHLLDPTARSISQIFDAMDEQQLEQIKNARLTNYVQSEKDHLPLSGDENQPFIITHETSAAQFDSIKNDAKSKGATINDALFAAYVCALSNVVRADPIVLDCPVNLRTYLSPEARPGFCNLTSNITCVVPSHVGTTFDHALLSVKKVMDAEKSSLEPLRVYWDLEEAYQTHSLSEAKRIFPSIYSIPVNGMTNIGIIDENKLTFADHVVRDVSISGSIKYAPYFQIAVTTFRKKITFCTNFHGTEQDRKFLDEFVNRLIEFLPHQY
ncbi:condensation domain-containing protein [Sporolactobacillus shoreicorticis]|uniref:Condensation domain-containing protein n=1 Tax=Sporolactobacillus shoreicorticis TaxID=1923877 RepID=A0ABW5S0W8_9BACL|nr:condensation domain-containing protein [Sporolactobacillus shoreicorticis]MCO7126999.1 condensation domain-containing protein [Sporolactobacillus shoreicorticis]